MTKSRKGGKFFNNRNFYYIGLFLVLSLIFTITWNYVDNRKCINEENGSNEHYEHEIIRDYLQEGGSRDHFNNIDEKKGLIIWMKITLEWDDESAPPRNINRPDCFTIEVASPNDFIYDMESGCNPPDENGILIIEHSINNPQDESGEWVITVILDSCGDIYTENGLVQTQTDNSNDYSIDIKYKWIDSVEGRGEYPYPKILFLSVSIIINSFFFIILTNAGFRHKKYILIIIGLYFLFRNVSTLAALLQTILPYLLFQKWNIFSSIILWDFAIPRIFFILAIALYYPTSIFSKHITMKSKYVLIAIFLIFVLGNYLRQVNECNILYFYLDLIISIPTYWLLVIRDLKCQHCVLKEYTYLITALLLSSLLSAIHYGSISLQNFMETVEINDFIIIDLIYLVNTILLCLIFFLYHAFKRKSLIPTLGILILIPIYFLNSITSLVWKDIVEFGWTTMTTFLFYFLIITLLYKIDNDYYKKFHVFMSGFFVFILTLIFSMIITQFLDWRFSIKAPLEFFVGLFIWLCFNGIFVRIKKRDNEFHIENLLYQQVKHITNIQNINRWEMRCQISYYNLLKRILNVLKRKLRMRYN